MLEIAIILCIGIVPAKWLGEYIARVYTGQNRTTQKIFGPIEKRIYKLMGVQQTDEESWRDYARDMLTFAGVSFFMIFALLMLQPFLAMEGEEHIYMSPLLAFNMAVSYVSNTNLQSAAPELTVNMLTNLLGVTPQHFISSAIGMSVAAAMFRGILRPARGTVGNFWYDVIRSILYVLLPLSIMFSLLLVAEGVIQSFTAFVEITTLEGIQSKLNMGPVASQVAIKQIGTNGGGIYAMNAAHPFENPTPLTNALELASVFLIPASFPFVFASMAGQRRYGYAFLGAMIILFLPFMTLIMEREQHLGPLLEAMPIMDTPGNMEGKEQRFSIESAALWFTAATATTSGSSNMSYSSTMPLSQLAAMLCMQSGEAIFGGTGFGMVNFLSYVILTAFIVGLMIGRTPVFVGKKIGLEEIRYAAILMLVPTVVTLIGTAIAVSMEAGRASMGSIGAQALSDVLYNASSAGFNNGSSLSTLNTNTVFYDLLLGVMMLISWISPLIAGLAIAGSMSRRQTFFMENMLPAYTPLFVIMLLSVVVFMGLLTFIPALALGPIAEHFRLFQNVI